MRRKWSQGFLISCKHWGLGDISSHALCDETHADAKLKCFLALHNLDLSQLLNLQNGFVGFDEG